MNHDRQDPDLLRQQFEAAIALRDAEDWEGAERVLRRIKDEYDSVPPSVNAVLGHVLWEQGNPADAIPFLELASRQSPRNEGISSALFHCLHEVGRSDAALVEGDRFLRGTNEGEYPEYRNAVAAVAAAAKK